MAATDPWITLGRTLEVTRRVCADSRYDVFIAHRDTERAGFMILDPHGIAGAPYVRSLAIAPEFRSLGIGASLLAFAEERYRGVARHLFMCVSSFNTRARALYERLGWIAVGNLPDFAIEGSSEILLAKRITPPPSPSNDSAPDPTASK
jgi:ribosomal protein S18 acetylase RimI-like enzyme